MFQKKLAPYKAILFDLDGTLVHYTRNYASFADSLAERFQVRDKESFLRVYHERIMQEGLVSFASAIGFALAITENPVVDLSPVSECIQEYAEGIEWLPHTQQLLELTAHLPRAIVTNGPHDMQLMAWSQSRIAWHILEIVISGSAGIRKPSPEIFYLACKKLKVEPSSEVLMIGDNVTADIEGARAAGLSAAHIDEVIRWL